MKSERIVGRPRLLVSLGFNGTWVDKGMGFRPVKLNCRYNVAKVAPDGNLAIMLQGNVRYKTFIFLINPDFTNMYGIVPTNITLVTWREGQRLNAKIVFGLASDREMKLEEGTLIGMIAEADNTDWMSIEGGTEEELQLEAYPETRVYVGE